MFTVLFLGSFLLAAASAAPVKDQNTPLIRTKRSEEAILFGNHQNFARMKKGDPHPHPFSGLDASAATGDGDDDDDADNPETPQLSEHSQQALNAHAPVNEGSETDDDDSSKPGDLEEAEEEEVAAAPKQEKTPKQDEEEQIERLLTNEAEVDPLTASEDKATEERIVEDLIEQQKHPEAIQPQVVSEGLPIAHPDKVLQDEDPTLEEELASGEVNGGYNKNYNTDYLFQPNLFKSYRERRSLKSKQRQQAVTAEQMMNDAAPAEIAKSRESRSLRAAATAEDMMGGSVSSPEVAVHPLKGRAKRDLPYGAPETLGDFIEREYYATGNNAIDEPTDGEEMGYYTGGPEVGDYYYPGGGGTREMDLEDMYEGGEREAEVPLMVERRADVGDADWGYAGYSNGEGPVLDMDPRGSPYGDGSYGSDNDGMYLPEDEEEFGGEENEIDPEEQRRMELLEYLYQTAAAEAADADDEQGPAPEVGFPYGEEAEEDDGGPGGYPGDLFEESWHDLGPAREAYAPLEPESEDAPYYAEEEEAEEDGPVKRQFMSFVPGNRKRAGDFYPYQYGPDGRWGAMVAEPENMEKRGEMAQYERLYELAQALNGPPGADRRSYDKRFAYADQVDEDPYQPVYFRDDVYTERRRK